METTYGSRRGDIPVIESLATLAFDGRRGAFFEEQLVAALRILASGDVAPQNFKGSWAGAMGHTQFIPTSYQAYAVDFGGDGRRDIWSDDPTDALASTAAYLSRFNFRRGRPWAVEVILPRGFDYEQAGRSVSRSVDDWMRLGVRAADGGAIPDHGAAGILAPAGARGVAVAAFSNFRSIERYNPAEAYVWGVGHLGDRLRGGSRFRASWPRDDRLLARAERAELQQRLNAGGFNAGAVDGRIGGGTRAAVRRWQVSRGMEPDGVATFATLEQLRR
jgi:membrane-bound lytic murein transglycosylase B